MHFKISIFLIFSIFIISSCSDGDVKKNDIIIMSQGNYNREFEVNFKIKNFNNDLYYSVLTDDGENVKIILYKTPSEYRRIVDKKGDEYCIKIDFPDNNKLNINFNDMNYLQVEISS